MDIAEALRQCQQDLAEADRRAGAAERRLAQEQENSQARARWLRKAKAEWGADNNVSFDVVWVEALALKAEKAAEQAAKETQRLEFCRVINHAISLGTEAANFLQCWNEGDWAGCREFDFEPNQD